MLRSSSCSCSNLLIFRSSHFNTHSITNKPFSKRPFQVATANPEVSLWIVNLSTPKYLFPLQIRPTNSVEPGSYITSASFFGDHQVSVVWLNRRQNVSVILKCRSQETFNCTDVSDLVLYSIFSWRIIFL